MTVFDRFRIYRYHGRFRTRFTSYKLLFQNVNLAGGGGGAENLGIFLNIETVPKILGFNIQTAALVKFFSIHSLHLHLNFIESVKIVSYHINYKITKLIKLLQ